MSGAASGLAAGVAARVLVLGALLLAWQLTAAIVSDPAVWPSATAVVARLWELWLANPTAWSESAWPSLARLGMGWALAVVIGIAVGTLIGLSSRARDGVEPVVAFLRSIPPPALLPLFIVLLGIGDAMKVTMIGVGVVWPILLNTADGVGSVDPLHRDTALVHRIGRADRLTRVILPSAAPKIFAGLRVSLSIAVILMVISEMVATVNGIGFELVQAQRGFRTVDVWATIVLLGIVGSVLNGALGAIEARVVGSRSAPGWSSA